MTSEADVRFTNCICTDFRYGRIVFPARDRYLYHALAECGDYGFGETVVFQPLLKPGDHVVDVGANIGAMSLFFSDVVGVEGTVRAFEASPFAFGLLRHNIELNGRANVICRRAIVSDVSGSGSFIDPDVARIDTVDFGSLSVAVHPGRIPGEFVETEKVRIDDLGIERCDLIKVDVEGHEASVMAGALSVVERFRPFLSIEAGDERDDLSWIAPLIALGYRVFCIATKVFTWPNYKHRDISDLSRDISLNAICIPSHRSHMELLGDIPRREVRSVTDLAAECGRFVKRPRI
ncbi:MAG: FkbM family methyltransferase [Nisaea sp.]|jgi:FkbM family methyltransferase|uniref:FkbM family methyltransferase n=1 Tax=Nisaea sp. TaxID=2024842 RepID=UPI001B0B8DF6|nr:FkbM family methyltransferase [Nisaea sp.]MBO6559497.1 FkbM family methyltransferase [Nisaea sp.]